MRADCTNKLIQIFRWGKSTSASSDFNVLLNAPFLKTAFCYLHTLCIFSCFLTCFFSPPLEFFSQIRFLLPYPDSTYNQLKYHLLWKFLLWMLLPPLLLFLLWFIPNLAFITLWLSVYSFSQRLWGLKGRKWVCIYVCPRPNRTWHPIGTYEICWQRPGLCLQGSS